MQVRRAARSDAPGIEGVVAAAFEETLDGRVVGMLRALDESGATRISLVAVDGDVVGHVQLSRAWIDARERLVDALVLTPLSVAPARQRHGIGTHLVKAALDEADALGVAAVFLEGDPRYYGTRGFTSAEPPGFLRPSARIPEPAFQVATLSGYEGWMTGQVVFPDALWQTDCVGLRDPHLGSVEKGLGATTPSKPSGA